MSQRKYNKWKQKPYSPPAQYQQGSYNNNNNNNNNSNSNNNNNNNNNNLVGRRKSTNYESNARPYEGNRNRGRMRHNRNNQGCVINRKNPRTINKGYNTIVNLHNNNNHNYSSNNSATNSNSNSLSQSPLNISNKFADQNHNHNHNSKEREEYFKQPSKYQQTPSPNLGNISRSELSYFNLYHYWVTEKSDAIRIMCYVTQNSVYFIDKNFDIYMINDMFYSDHGLLNKNGGHILLDGELVLSLNRNQRGKKLYLYKIFDCMAYNGRSISNENSSIRFKFIGDFMKKYNKKLLNKVQKSKGKYGYINTKQKRKNSDLNLNDEKELVNDSILHDIHGNDGDNDGDNDDDDDDDDEDVDFDDYFNYLEFKEDEENVLNEIGSKLKNPFQYTKTLKDSIISLIHNNNIPKYKTNLKIFNKFKFSNNNQESISLSPISSSPSKSIVVGSSPSNLSSPSSSPSSNIFPDPMDEIAKLNNLSSILPVLFYQKTHYPATKMEITKLINSIHKRKNGEYIHTDPKTGIKTKNDGLIFCPEDNNYLMSRNISSNASSSQSKNNNQKNNNNSDLKEKPELIKNNNHQNLICRQWKQMGNEIISVKVCKRGKLFSSRRNEMDLFINNSKLSLYIYDNNKKKEVWFNDIDVGDNSNECWNKWQLNQRSKLFEIIEHILRKNKVKCLPQNYIIIKCNYNFLNKSWNILQSNNKMYPDSVQICENVISRIEENVTFKDLIDACM